MEKPRFNMCISYRPTHIIQTHVRPGLSIWRARRPGLVNFSFGLTNIPST